MVGRTNALVHPLVSSVNGMSGVVVLTPGDIGYDGTAAYGSGTLGEAVQAANDVITSEMIQSMYTVPQAVQMLNTPPRMSVLEQNGVLNNGEEEQPEEQEETVEENEPENTNQNTENPEER